MPSSLAARPWGPGACRALPKPGTYILEEHFLREPTEQIKVSECFFSTALSTEAEGPLGLGSPLYLTDLCCWDRGRVALPDFLVDWKPVGMQ